jgi:hypothetical protein
VPVIGLAARDGGGNGREGMALLRRLFYRKPPDRLLEIADRVYGKPMLLLPPAMLLLFKC